MGNILTNQILQDMAGACVQVCGAEARTTGIAGLPTSKQQHCTFAHREELLSF